MRNFLDNEEKTIVRPDKRNRNVIGIGLIIIGAIFFSTNAVKTMLYLQDYSLAKTEPFMMIFLGVIVFTVILFITSKHYYKKFCNFIAEEIGIRIRNFKHKRREYTFFAVVEAFFLMVYFALSTVASNFLIEYFNKSDAALFLQLTIMAFYGLIFFIGLFMSNISDCEEVKQDEKMFRVIPKKLIDKSFITRQED